MNIMKKSSIFEIIVFCLFCILVICVSIFHEPWLDEFQAWGISKDSIFNIVFVLPHYEGHPPLWHLVLKVFSSLKLPAEIGIRIPNILFMFSAVWLLIFKSPFPKLIRLLLPFTYFIIYQYSIINRPYSIFCFAIFLSAVLYKERNQYPMRFIMSLILLCLSCAYGIIISVGIVIVWLIEIIREDNFHIKSFLHDKRFKSVLFIFFVCLFLTVIMFPYKDTYAIALDVAPDYRLKFLYSFFILPCDSLFYNFLDNKTLNIFTHDLSEFIKIFNNPSLDIIFLFWNGCILGVIVNIFLFITFKRLHKLLLFYIPYLMLLLFSLTYISPHHIGLITIYIISMFWYALQNSKIPEKDIKNLCLFVMFCIVVQIYWGICSFANEIKYEYWPSRVVAKYIKQNNLDKYKIMSKWVLSQYKHVDRKTRRQYYGKKFISGSEYFNFINKYKLIKMEHLNIQFDAVCINQYFNKNIFYNFNNNGKLYILLKKLSADENNQLSKEWKKHGVPELIFGTVDLDRIYDIEILSKYKYIILKNFNIGYVWKDKVFRSVRLIYIRKDIYDRDFLLNEKNQRVNFY